MGAVSSWVCGVVAIAGLIALNNDYVTSELFAQQTLGGCHGPPGSASPAECINDATVCKTKDDCYARVMRCPGDAVGPFSDYAYVNDTAILGSCNIGPGSCEFCQRYCAHESLYMDTGTGCDTYMCDFWTYLTTVKCYNP